MVERMKTQFTVIGFDLDGTLVNSLPDLALSVNSALADFDLPQAPEELVLTWIGNGAPVLIARALEWAKVQTGKDFSDAEMEQVKERFNVYYAENLCNVSRLYPNVKRTNQLAMFSQYWRHLASIIYSVKCLVGNHYPRLNHIQAHCIIYVVNLA